MLHKTAIIDLIARSENGRYDLVFVIEKGEWEQHGALYALQEKLNTYSSYALDGAMTERYPESEGQSKVIRIMSVDRPPDEAVQFLMKVEALLVPEGLQLKLERIGGDATDGSEGPPADSSQSSSV
ncbi:MAG: hypothetical protein JNM40_09695 [Myxococcales bacterium]|nr:hypothetical protein [Myxococcales bacterium]